MCDTMVALPPATAGGVVLFAKNSDRERDEAQFLDWCRPRAMPRGRAALHLHRYPQAARTHAVLLSRPYWLWGAEMGPTSTGW